MAKAPAAPQKSPAGGKAPAGKPQQQPKRAGKGAPAAAPAAPQGRPKPTGDVPARLKDRFKTTILPNLVKERGYPNPYAAPRLDKIVISMGVGEARDNAKIMDFAVADLQTITDRRETRSAISPGLALRPVRPKADRRQVHVTSAR